MPYPVTFEADYVEQRSRLTTFFRLILAIPLGIVVYIYGIFAAFAMLIAWFAIVLTGEYPEAMYDFVAGYTRFLARFTAYSALLVDPYPAFGGSDDPAYPVRMQFHRLQEYSRLKTFFRFLLAIPILILRYVVGILLEIAAIAGWFVVLITGKMPRGLFDLMLLANSYTARSDAYVFLLSETYPPFQEEPAPTVGAP